MALHILMKLSQSTVKLRARSITFFWSGRLRQVGAARSTVLRLTWASSRRQSRGAFCLVEGIRSVGVELDHVMVRTGQNYHGGQNRSAWSCRCSTSTPGGIRPGGLPRCLELITKLAASLNPLVDNARASFQARAATPCCGELRESLLLARSLSITLSPSQREGNYSVHLPVNSGC